MRYVFLLLMLFSITGFSKNINYKYADDIVASVKYWRHIETQIGRSLTDLMINKENIILLEKIKNCYKQITEYSNEDDVIKCFAYDYLSYTMGIMGFRVIEIDNSHTTISITSSNSAGARLYENLLKIGISQDKVNILIGGYFNTANRPTFDFLRYKNSKQRLVPPQKNELRSCP